MNTTNSSSVRIATTDEIAGAEIASTLGLVIGIAIRSRGIGGNIMAGLATVGNGSAIDEFRDDLLAIRSEAIVRMGRVAEDLGANAVVGTRFDSADVGREMVEVVAYGTAVVLRVTGS
jgi:uncharacterized protein YbjQ (UPF0145 family)